MTKPTTFEDFLTLLPSAPSKVQRALLERLWREGEGFPRGWVTSAELLQLSGQKYFDRRLRELRDETGLDIEAGRDGLGAYAWRLNSVNLQIANPRTYLSDAVKRALFERHKGRCAVCGQQVEAGLRGLQADHKVPLTRGGGEEPSNWQPLCVECNVGKRRACAGCILACGTCPWAFPERSGHRLAVWLSEDTHRALNDTAATEGRSLSEVVESLLQMGLKRRAPRSE
jgi:hypothetical protein